MSDVSVRVPVVSTMYKARALELSAAFLQYVQKCPHVMDSVQARDGKSRIMIKRPCGPSAGGFMACPQCRSGDVPLHFPFMMCYMCYGGPSVFADILRLGEGFGFERSESLK